jgi:3-deoxy-D-manno-octulosonic-acid transferase
VTETLPFSLTLYRTATQLLARFLPGVLSRRAAKGREDPTRIGERLGTAPIVRPTGTLVWIHGASVGEAIVGFALAQELGKAQSGLTFLFTSGTRTSADLMARKLSAPDLHRYVPVDTPAATQAFVAGWKPDLAVFVEGEIWPNLLLATKQAGVPLALVNARMTARSVKGWRGRAKTAELLFSLFDVALPADTRTFEALSLFRNGPIGTVGNLKLAAPPPIVNVKEAKALSSKLGKRPIWLAASTHEGEESVLLAAHAALRLGAPDALLILAPRHPERAQAVEIECRKRGLVPVCRSMGQVPGPQIPVWLWDTLGELGLAMSLAPVTFVAGSLTPGIGGHNPVEPVQLGSTVVSASFVGNFLDLYQALEDQDGAIILDDHASDRIALTLAGLLGDPERRVKLSEAARSVIAQGSHAMADTVAVLLQLLKRPKS